MTHYILFLIMLLIGFAYSIKYGKKAKADITKFNELKNLEKDQTNNEN
ncbi:hypothetical protein [Flavobacterium sp.]|nr:hypothetical protein [Flavobacterium sp.]